MKIKGNISNFGIAVYFSLFLTVLTAQPAFAAAPDGKASWQSRWDKLLQEAGQERKVVVYSTSGSQVRTGLAKPFKDRYNLELEFVSGRAAEILQRINMERAAGMFMCDLLISGTSSQMLFKQAGMLEPVEPLLLLPEVNDRKVWFEGRHFFLDRERYILAFVSQVSSILAYNTELVKAPPPSLRLLLDPKWKGRIAMSDPSIAGAGNLFAMVAGEKYGKDYFLQLAKQEPVVSRNLRLLVEWVARGKYAFVIGAGTEQVYEFMSAGAPIKFAKPADNTFSSASMGLLSLLNKRPHPAAAAVFANWLLSREGQTAYVKTTGSHSRRLDVTTEFTPPDTMREPNMDYTETGTEEMEQRKIYWQGVAKEIFGPFLR